MKLKPLFAASALLGSLAACSSSSDDGQGTASFTTYGEDYIEQQLPASEFEDGWAVTFEKFFVVIGGVAVGEAGAAPAATMPGFKLVSMKAPSGDKPLVTFANIPAKAYTHVSYRIAPATAETELGDGATEADKQAMVAGGYSVFVEGTATKGAESKKFSWGFATDTLYDRCKSEESGKETEGIVVTNGGTENVQLTIHGDHLFYDDLQSPDAKLRFDNIAAADTGNDGTVTLEDLATVKLAAIPAEKGPYGTGSAAGINDLRAFVEGLSRTVGHFRGEGECFASAK